MGHKEYIGQIVNIDFIVLKEGEITLMDLTVNKESVAINEVIFDGVQELPIESDFMLPDYCPDILRVLKCSLNPVVTSHQSTGEKLIIDGMAVFKVIYISENECVCNYEHKLPFSKTITLKNNVESPIITASATTNYVNCRAVSHRRLDARGAIGISVKAIARHGENIMCNAQGKNIELKKKTVNTSPVVGDIFRQFTVREELELASGKPRISHIINKNVCIEMTECKLIANKVILKADLQVSLLYVSDIDNTNLCKCDFSLPVSQVIDLDGVDENCKCSVVLSVHGCEIELRPDLDDEGCALDFEATIGADIKAYCHHELVAVSDLYSTEYETAFETKPVALDYLTGLINETYKEKNSFELPDEDVEEICEVWCDATLRNSQATSKGLNISSLIKICMLVKNSEGKMQYYERVTDSAYTNSSDDSIGDTTSDTNVQVKGCTFELSGTGTIDIEFEVQVQASVFTQLRENLIYDVKVKDDSVKDHSKMPALTIYYADIDESIWEIAKKYNTSVTSILEQNEISDEILKSRQMLLIPVKNK